MTAVLPDERMSDVDALVFAVEREPRQRTTIAAVARFASPLERRELRHRVERASRLVPRLRQRVIPDPIGVAGARWAVDPSFRLSRHLRSIRLDGADDLRLVHVVRDLITQPFDPAHPLWEFTLVTGLDDGGCALVMKSHHCVTDGVGGVRLLLELFDLERRSDPHRERLPPAPVGGPAAETPRGLTTLHDALGRAADPAAIADLSALARRFGETLGSAYRMYRPVASPPGMPAPRSDALDLRFFSIPLVDLKAAGARIDGTVNDAFVTALALGVSDHLRTGPGGPLRVSVPISTREGDDGLGNRWTPGRIEVDLRTWADADLDPDSLGVEVQAAMRRVRTEPAHALLPPLAAALRYLPAAATGALFGAMSSGLDIAASNVPGSATPLFLCGEEVIQLVPFGPLSGCAVNVTLLSHAGHATIGIASDPAAIGDPDRLARDLQAGFAAVVKGS